MRGGKCWIIDYSGVLTGGGDRDLYLENARTWLGRHREHDELDALVRNVEAVASRSRKPIINIVGHGRAGAIGAGCGDTVSNKDMYLGRDDANRFVTVKGRVGAIILWGCHVGAGKEGLNLLTDLATAADALCMAPNGWVNCDATNGFSLVEGARWQVVTPFGGRPLKLEAPEDFVAREVSAVLARKPAGSRGPQVDYADPHGEWHPSPMDIRDYADLKTSVLKKGSPLGAFLTGWLRIHKSGTRIYRILNDLLLECVETGERHFIDSRFRKRL